MEQNITKDMFRRIPKDDQEAEKIARPIITFWEDVWRRLKMNKAAIASIFVIILLLVMVVIGPYLNEYDYKTQDSSVRNTAPNKEYWFGTDSAGRDIFTRAWMGGRISLAIGIICAFIAMIVGVAYGAIAGLVGGATDTFMMRFVEVLSSLPYLLIIVLVTLWLDSNTFGTILLALSVTSWTGTARMVRGEVLRLKNQEFVLAAETLGVPKWKIIMRHLVPNALSIVIVGVTFDIPGFIFSEAFLSYLGVGLEPPQMSWGIMCSEAQQQFMFFPYQLIFPSLLIGLTMLSFTLLGDGLRDALDPRLRK
ncbi:MAG: ABC transporter permease [Tissierellia bacterium]|nr:ABC transporter permease [Tissierellia bacterium]